MATPKSGYYIEGKRVPGTTTIIGRFKDSGGLIFWAYNQGIEHEGLRREGKPAPSRLYEVTQKAADIGTIVHSMVEAKIKGEPQENINKLLFDLPTEEDRKKAESGFRAYETWHSMCDIKMVEQEVQLISHEYKFGGTPDGIGLVNGKLCLIDWKTSNSVYQDYLIQLAAYKHLIEDGIQVLNGEPLHMEINGGFHLCRFSKENGDFSHHYFPDLSEAWEAFRYMRKLYDLDKQLKKRAS